MITAKLNTPIHDERVTLDLPLWLAAMIWRWSYSGVASPDTIPEIHELNVALGDLLQAAGLTNIPYLKTGLYNNVLPAPFKQELK